LRPRPAKFLHHEVVKERKAVQSKTDDREEREKGRGGNVDLCRSLVRRNTCNRSLRLDFIAHGIHRANRFQ
jgi:hypothetical protein